MLLFDFYQSGFGTDKNNASLKIYINEIYFEFFNIDDSETASYRTIEALMIIDNFTTLFRYLTNNVIGKIENSFNILTRSKVDQSKEYDRIKSGTLKSMILGDKEFLDNFDYKVEFCQKITKDTVDDFSILPIPYIECSLNFIIDNRDDLDIRYFQDILYLVRVRLLKDDSKYMKDIGITIVQAENEIKYVVDKEFRIYCKKYAEDNARDLNYDHEDKTFEYSDESYADYLSHTHQQIMRYISSSQINKAFQDIIDIIDGDEGINEDTTLKQRVVDIFDDLVKRYKDNQNDQIDSDMISKVNVKRNSKMLTVSQIKELFNNSNLSEDTSKPLCIKVRDDYTGSFLDFFKIKSAELEDSFTIKDQTVIFKLKDKGLEINDPYLTFYFKCYDIKTIETARLQALRLIFN